MAAARSGIQVLSIGCSCINRFQFDFFVERNPDRTPLFPRGLFDWNIASLDASLRLLDMAAEGQLREVLLDEKQYTVAWNTLILNAAIPGLSFFHEDTPVALLEDKQRREAFIGKVTHLAQPFLTPHTEAETHLVWSNLQPNLPDTVENVIPWPDFILTEERYAHAKSICRRIFGARTSVHFLTTPQDCGLTEKDRPDVHVMNLPRGQDFKGDPLLYEPILRRIVGLSA